MTKMELTGAQLIIRKLTEHKVNTVFGYPGGTALDLFDDLYKHSDQLTHILTADECGAAHAADGYSRSTGDIGVVFATSGPGATNLITGLATAFMDSVPLLAITVNVSKNLIGHDAFQEIYITGATMPVTKHNYFVDDIGKLPGVLDDAFKVAQSGRPGPVLVDVTKDVTAAGTDYSPGEYIPHQAGRKVQTKVTRNELQAIADKINSAKKPVIFLGGGFAARGRQPLIELLNKADIPITHTIMAAGMIGFDNPRNLGIVGMHGSVAANTTMDEADVMLALGTRFSDRVALNPEKFAKNSVKIQVDIDESEFNKNVHVDHMVVDDAADFVRKLLPFIEEKHHDAWNERMLQLKKHGITSDLDTPLPHPDEVIRDTCAMADKDTIYVTDVGQHQMWAAQFLGDHNTYKFITSGGLGTMGFGYGAAIGAQLGNPDKRVIHITGDGSFHMCLNEACTAVSYDLPIITVIMNNSVLGMVYQWQTIFKDKRYSATDPGRKTNFVKVGEGFGVHGYRAETRSEYIEALKSAMKNSGPSWIEVKIDRNEKVLPFIPGGGTTEDMIIG